MGELESRGTRRRVYLWAVGCIGPLLPVVGWLRADEPLAVPVYSALTVVLAWVYFGLLTRRVSVERAQAVVVTTVPAVALIRLVTVAVISPLPLADLRTITVETIGPTLVGVVLVIHLAFDQLRARDWSVALWLSFTVILSPRIVDGLGRDVAATTALLRQVAILGVTAGLAYALASLKAQLAEERARAQALDELANTDSLTGARNRRGVEEALRQQLLRVDRYGGTLSVALLDLDRFKDRNDHHGHSAGDAALTTVVAALRAELRGTDVLGRWGGDELLVVAPETSADEALRSARRWRATIAELRLAAGPGLITTSIGVATYGPGDDADTLLIRADRALYAAKHAGGDQVATDAGLPTPPLTRPSDGFAGGEASAGRNREGVAAGEA